jgi:NAD(P)-dependent dehydrogenase (short-subunit alcohol dehydrogenase family)
MPTALITGANRGLGLAFTGSYAADGWQVHACCRYPDKAQDLKAMAANVIRHRLDVTNELHIAGLARELSAEPIDLLINNAGIYGPKKPLGDTDVEAWARVMAVNMMAPLRLAERLTEHIVRSELKRVVNISSRLGSIAENDSGGDYPYRTSKAALNMVTRGLAADLADRGVTVVSMNPGWVRTDMGGQQARLSPEESVAKMRAVIDALIPEQSGRFYSHDGSEIPW